jgi:hypothetical protein
VPVSVANATLFGATANAAAHRARYNSDLDLADAIKDVTALVLGGFSSHVETPLQQVAG